MRPLLVHYVDAAIKRTDYLETDLSASSSDFIAAVNIRAKALVVNDRVASFQPNASDSHSLGANDGIVAT
jgi:hypothetical protein